MSVAEIAELNPRQFNGDFQDDFLSVDQLSGEDLRQIYHETDAAEWVFKNLGTIALLEGHCYDLVFWHSPSTRTKESFKRAISRLGGTYSDFDQSSCSEIKGETFEDTISTLDAYLNPERDSLIIRNKHVGQVALAADIARAPVINAGDGIGGHPTQGVLDGRTAVEHVPNIADASIAFYGDLAHARTVNSTAPVLGKLGMKRMYFVTPVEELRAAPATVESIRNMGIEVIETDDLQAVAPQVDLIYGLRTQYEAFEDADAARKRLEGACLISQNMIQKSAAKIMHPGPEDSKDPSFHPEVRRSLANIVQVQAANGLITRMATLGLMAGKPISQKLGAMEVTWEKPSATRLTAVK